MPELRLHFSNRQQPDHPLTPGVHRLVRQASGIPGVGDHVQGALLAQFCVDRRGLWLQVAAGARGLHVNGRPVRRMALLRAGDAVYADGVEMVVQAPPVGDGQEEAGDPVADPCLVLRGVGGSHHGRSFTLGAPRLVGAAREADIRIEDPAFPQRHALLERRGNRVLLRDLGGEGSVVNGVRVREAVLSAGDQVVFDGRHRFVVELPTAPAGSAAAPPGGTPPREVPEDRVRPAGAGTRLPLLLLAALLLAGLFSALLWFGAG